MSTAAELREEAAIMRVKAARYAARHGEVARAMARAGAENAHRALELEAGVADCMARRFTQWAARLEEAAYELENP